VAVYTVGAIKDVPGVRTYVSVDGGMGDNIRPALYGSRYVAVTADKANDKPDATVTIAGKYCESGDVLVRDAQIAKVVAGNLIAIPAAGAYAPSMASTYNVNARPAIVTVANGKSKLIRRRESYADMMAQDVV
jgi:diaminopimelate decarboxylase